MQQALPGAGECWRRVARRRHQGFERSDGIAEIRREEVHSLVACPPPDFRDDGVPGCMRVQLGDEIDRGRQTLRPPVYRERFVAEILVHVPYPATVPWRRGSQQLRAAIREAERGQPALHDEAVRLRDRGGEALEHEALPGSQMQPVHLLLQRLEPDRRPGVEAGAHRLPQQLADLRRAGFLHLPERALESLAQIDGPAHHTGHFPTSMPAWLGPFMITPAPSPAPARRRCGHRSIAWPASAPIDSAARNPPRRRPAPALLCPWSGTGRGPSASGRKRLVPVCWTTAGFSLAR